MTTLEKPPWKTIVVRGAFAGTIAVVQSSLIAIVRWSFGTYLPDFVSAALEILR